VLRGKEVSRIEGFSDAVLGFTLTLLVVFPAFAATFALICWIWYEHHLFFRRYDLERRVHGALLHWNAWRQRERLRLDTLDLFDARAGMRRHMISVVLGLLSVAIVALLPRDTAFAGLIVFLLGPAHGIVGYLNGRRRDGLRASR